MARAIAGVAVYRPAWRAGGASVEGPDEDAFTLCVEALGALEQLPGPAAPGPIAAIHVAGALPDGAGWEVPEAIGAPGAELRRHGKGLAGLLEALQAAQHDSHEGSATAVVAVDLAEPSGGAPSAPFESPATSVAFRLSERPGLALLSHALRVAGPGGRQHAWPLLERLEEPAGRDPPGPVALQIFAVGRPAPLPPAPLLARWEVVARAGSRSPPETAPGATAPYALAIADLARAEGPPAIAGLYEVGPERDVLGVLRLGGAPAPTVERGGARDGLERPPEAVRRARGPALDARSEGAYLPFPRYAEGLASRWRLEGERCGRCQYLSFPARGACRGCGAVDGLRAEGLPREGGVVEAVTTVGAGAQPTEFDPQVEERGPYSVAIVRFGESVRATLQVTDAPAGALRVGDRVRTALRRLYATEGAWRYGLKAVPSTPAPRAPGR